MLGQSLPGYAILAAPQITGQAVAAHLRAQTSRRKLSMAYLAGLLVILR